MSILAWHKAFRRYGFAKTLSTRAKTFLGHFPRTAFWIQAPQALQTITGYGVVLGGIMGTMTDAFWATVRIAQGKTVTVVGPPPADPLGKAVYHATDGVMHYNLHQGLSFEDHFLSMLADIYALDILMQNVTPATLEERLDTVLDQPLTLRWPWWPTSIEFLEENNLFPTQEDADAPRITYREMYTLTTDRFPDWLTAVRQDFPPRFVTPAILAAITQVGARFYDWLNGTTGTLRPIFDDEELALARAFEFGTFPPGDVPRGALELWNIRARQLAASAGRVTPDAEDLRRAANQVLGGWASR